MAAGFVVVIAISWINNLTFMVLALPFTAASLAIFTVLQLPVARSCWKIACLAVAVAAVFWLGIQAFLDAFTAYSQRLNSMFGNVNRFCDGQSYVFCLIDKLILRLPPGRCAVAWLARVCRTDSWRTDGQFSVAPALFRRVRRDRCFVAHERRIYVAHRHLALGRAGIL